MVPRGEIERRLGAFRTALAEGGLAAALIVQAADLYYLTGTVQDAHLVVPADGEPILLVRRSIDRARAESPLDGIEPLRSLRDLPAALRQIGIAQGQIGMELDVLPAAAYLAYARRLEGYEVSDCSAALRAQRARKSAWELERIRRAGAMIAEVVDWVPEIVREGMTEIELAAELERLLRRDGHQGIVRFRGFNGEMHFGSILAGPSAAVAGGSDTPIVGPGPNIAVGKGASPRPIGRSEPIVVDLVGAWDGYLADQTRTFSLGPLAGDFTDAYEHARAILHAVAARTQPGVPASALHDHAHELAGTAANFMGVGDERVRFVGHGFGLEIDEPPFLAAGHGLPLEQGMVFALEPKFLFPGVGAVGVENSYAVTADGVELLTPSPDALVEV